MTLTQYHLQLQVQVRHGQISAAMASSRWNAAVHRYRATHRGAPGAASPRPIRRTIPVAKDPGLVATERVVNAIPVVGPIITTLAEALAPDPTFHVNSESDLRTAIENLSLVGGDQIPKLIALWNQAHPELMYDPLTRQRVPIKALPPAQVDAAMAATMGAGGGFWLGGVVGGTWIARR